MLILLSDKLPGTAVFVVLLTTNGCHPWIAPPRPASESPGLAGFRESITADQTISHNAGQVLSGQPLRHVFSYKNESRYLLEMPKDQQIRTTCGCTRVKLSRERLNSGESTELTLEIDTESRLGDVSESATVPWTRADGGLQHCQFTLSGQVISAFALDPPELTFSKKDLQLARPKIVRCRSDLPIDWQQVRLQPDASYLEIESIEVDTPGGEMVFSVRCSPTHQGESRRATIRLAGPPVAPEPNPSASIYHAVLPVYSDDLSALRVAPSSPALHPGADKLTWNGYIILTGDQIASGVRLRDISADQCQVRFETSSLGSAAQRVDITLVGPLNTLDESHIALRLTFSTGLNKSIPFRIQ